MSLHVYVCQLSDGSDRLRLVVAHESGAVTLYDYSNLLEEPSFNGNGWQEIWKMKGHLEAGKQMQSS
jgi:hypothetical protein